MLIKALRIKDFRQFKDRTIKCNSQILLICGSNASGKSSILEAINLLSVGGSFRASRVEEMVKFKQELARVKGKIVAGEKADNFDLGGLDELVLSVILTRGEVQGKKTRRKLFSVNENRRRKSDFVGQLLVVLFRPEDLRLVEGSPSRRRNYLDNVLCLSDKNYRHSLTQYKQALRKRNKLLSMIKEGNQSPSVLKYWDMTLVKHGVILQQKRKDFLNFINDQVQAPLEMEVDYRPSVISQKRIESHRRAELGAGYTLIGPQKDNLAIQLNFSEQNEVENYLDLELYGSRGQKRLGVLWLKMAEMEFLEVATNKKPILILDDILSELDDDSRNLVLELIKKQQTIITATDETIFDQMKSLFDDDVSFLNLEKDG